MGPARLAFAAAVLGVVLFLGAACRSAPAQQQRIGSSATLSIIEPAPGADVGGSTIRVRLALQGARIIAETTTRLQPDEGHVHLLLDGKTVSMTYGLEQDVQVTPGSHLLQAEFVAGDHLPFNPRVLTTVAFTVR
jgi:hypothetical protein